MDIANVMLRAIDNKGAVYLPYSFEGDWNEVEKKEISAVLDGHVPFRVDASYCNFLFTKVSSTFFMMSRFGWDRTMVENSAHGIAQRIVNYWF